MSRRYAEATPAFLWLLRRRLRPVPPGEGLPLMLDRTGLSLVGAGAWAAAIPGGRGQRGWRPRHRGGDRSGVILVHPLPVRCPPCGRRRAPRSPTSGPIPGERDRFRPLALPVAVWAAFWGRFAEVAAAAGSRAVGRRWAWRCAGLVRQACGLPCVQPRLARWPARRALTRWCAARGGEAARCAERRCGPGASARHAASPVPAAPDRRRAGRRPRAVPAR